MKIIPIIMKIIPMSPELWNKSEIIVKCKWLQKMGIEWSDGDGMTFLSILIQNCSKNIDSFTETGFVHFL